MINNGPSPASGVQVVDELPDDVTFVSGTGPGGEVLEGINGVITYDFGNGPLASGGQFELMINATIDSSASGNLINTATVSSVTDETDPSNNTDVAVTAVDPETSSFSGLVFHDRNNNGIQDSDEPGIGGVVLTMTGQDFLGNSVNIEIQTDENGLYSFDNLAAGTYDVTQTQPEGFRDGQTILGQGATAQALDNLFAQIALASDTDATNFIFTELSLPLSKRQFLASSNGR